MKQLEAWALLPPSVRRKAKLVIAGAVRHADDQRILDALKRQAASLDGVEFLVSAPRHEIMALLQTASIGLTRCDSSTSELRSSSSWPLIKSWPTRRAGPCWTSWARRGERGFVATDAWPLRN